MHTPQNLPIGDDIHAVAHDMKEKLGFSCEGYRGVSQSAGHHIANNGIFTHVVGEKDETKGGRFKINMLGEYNIGSDAFEKEKPIAYKLGVGFCDHNHERKEPLEGFIRMLNFAKEVHSSVMSPVWRFVPRRSGKKEGPSHEKS